MQAVRTKLENKANGTRGLFRLSLAGRVIAATLLGVAPALAQSVAGTTAPTGNAVTPASEILPDVLPANCIAHVIGMPLLTRDGSPAVSVAFDGVEGAAFIGLAQTTTGVFEFSNKLLPHDDSVKVQTVTGLTSTRYIHIDHLKLGRGVASNFEAFDLGEEGLPKVAGKRVLGVIGFDILGNYDVLIDMPHKQIVLFKQAPAAGCAPIGQWLGKGSFAAPLYASASGTQDLVQLSVGGVPVGMELEPGSNASIMRLDDAKSLGLDQAHLQDDPRARTQASNTLIGWRHHFTNFKLGNWTGHALDVDIEDSRYNLLGLGFFRNRIVLAAFPTGMLYFSPEIQDLRPAGERDSSDSPTRSRLAGTTVHEQ